MEFASGILRAVRSKNAVEIARSTMDRHEGGASIKARKSLRARTVALTGIIAALCVTVLYLGLLTSGEWTAIFISSALLQVPITLAGIRAGLFATLVSNFLSFLLLQQPGYAMTFGFISFYTVFRAFRLVKGNTVRFLQWTLKFGYFNVAFISWMFLNKFLLNVDVLQILTVRVPRSVPKSLVFVVFFVALQFAFLVYESLFNRLEQTIERKLQSLL